MNIENSELLEAENHIEEKYGNESRAYFNNFIAYALDDDHDLTLDEILYVGELLARGSRQDEHGAQ